MEKESNSRHNLFFEKTSANGSGSVKLVATNAAKHVKSQRNSRNGKTKHLQITEQLKKWLFFPLAADSLKISLVPSEPPIKKKLIEEILFLTEEILSSLAIMENFYFLSAEIKFSDGTLPSRADSCDPHIYIFDGLSIITTFNGETRTNPAIVNETDGRFYFGTVIETSHPVNDNDSVERVLFVKKGCHSIVLKNLKVRNHRVYCNTIVMEPFTGRKTEEVRAYAGNQ